MLDKSKYENGVLEIIKGFPNLGQEENLMRVLLNDIHSSFEFYFKIDGVYKCEQDLEESGIIVDSQFCNVRWDLLDILEDMQTELKNNNEKVWNMLIFTLYKSGDFTAEYSYDEIDESLGEMVRWRYHRLGMIPNEKSMHYIEEE